jgi:hypothetical protein
MDAVETSFDCSDLENPMGERSKDVLRVNFVFLLLLWLKYFQNEVGKLDFSRQI